MRKKSQLTLFVIIAIIIIAIIIVAYFFYTQQQKPIKTEQQIKFVNDYIAKCFEGKTKQAIITIARQSGYYEMPQESITFIDQKAAYYLKENKSLVPSKEVVENQINLWLKDNIDDCFNISTQLSLEKKYCNIKTNLNNNTLVNFDCKIEIKINEKIYEINGFDNEFNISLLPLLNASKEIVENYKETEPDYICIECIDEIAKKYNLNITIVPITKEIYDIEHIWFLLNSTQKIEDKFLIWRFVTEFK